MNPLQKIHESWKPFFKKHQVKITDQLKAISEKDFRRCSPEISLVFSAFSADINKLTCCIVGQDPYPSKKHATGYAFDVPEGTTRQSLFIIQKIAEDYGIKLDSFDPIKDHVMLLNTNLTTEVGIVKSGGVHDWEWFTQLVVEYIKKKNPFCQFVFLGKIAQRLNTVNGNNYYHPRANARSSKDMFNVSFFNDTEDSIKWKKYYAST